MPDRDSRALIPQFDTANGPHVPTPPAPRAYPHLASAFLRQLLCAKLPEWDKWQPLPPIRGVQLPVAPETLALVSYGVQHALKRVDLTAS